MGRKSSWFHRKLSLGAAFANGEEEAAGSQLAHSPATNEGIKDHSEMAMSTAAFHAH